MHCDSGVLNNFVVVLFQKLSIVLHKSFSSGFADFNFYWNSSRKLENLRKVEKKNGRCKS